MRSALQYMPNATVVANIAFVLSLTPTPPEIFKFVLGIAREIATALILKPNDLVMGAQLFAAMTAKATTTQCGLGQTVAACILSTAKATNAPLRDLAR